MRAGRKFAPRFARLVRILLSETGANQADGIQTGHQEKFPRIGFHFSFHKKGDLTSTLIIHKEFLRDHL